MAEKVPNLKIGFEPIKKWYMIKTKDNFIILGGCWAYKSGVRLFVWYPNMGTFGKSAHLLVAKNGTLGARTKNLRALL